MNGEEKIESLASIRQSHPPVKNTNEVHERNLSSLDKLALLITQRIGTMRFFFLIFSWTVIWLSWNMFAPKEFRFDPYPAFVLWLFISNLIQIHLMPLIMVGQNIQGRREKIRSEHDYQTDRKSEKEIETVLLHLEQQQKLMHAIVERLERLEKKK